MPEAQLKITAVGGPEAVAVIRDLEQALAAAQGRIDKLAETSRAKRTRGARTERQTVVQEAIATAQGVGGAYRTAAATIERTEKLVTRAKLRELALQGDAQKRFVALYTEAHKRATAAFELEVGKRGQLSDREKRQVETVALAMVSAHERAERERTATTRREAERRRVENNRAVDRRARNAGQAASEALTGGASLAQTVHGDIQSTRARRAASLTSLAGAVVQSGGSQADVVVAQQALSAEVTNGRLRGLSLADVSGAIAGAQGQFSVLSPENGETRAQALGRQIELLSYARDTFQDPGQVLRLAGALGQQGIRGNDQRQVLMQLTGLANAGAIELGNLTSEALGPLMQNIANATGALGPRASASDRADAVRRATVQSMAVAEVGAAAGLSARDALNANSKLTRAMDNPRIAANLYAGMRGRGLSEEQISTVIESREENGQTVRRFRSRDGLTTMASVMGLMGGDVASTLNLLQGGGHGTPMVIDAQTRRLVGAMQSQTTGGEGMDARIRRFIEGASFTEADVDRGRAARNVDASTAITTNEEMRAAALLDNTKELTNLSNALAAYDAQNPMTKYAVGGGLAVGSKAAGALLGGGSGVGAAAMAMLGGIYANFRAIATGETVDGRRLSGTDRARRVAGVAAGTVLALPTGGASLAVGAAGPGAVDAGRGLLNSPGGNDVVEGLLRLMPDRLAAALRTTPLTVSAQDATHAATVGSTPTAAP